MHGNGQCIGNAWLVCAGCLNLATCNTYEGTSGVSITVFNIQPGAQTANVAEVGCQKDFVAQY
ncbi:3100_t:CDS:2 [Scutellospora calospora]|uniref:3100_t:CDS:1 n=1 Tax=Scutellospora calospora TaxID=85575 RepID=A0ACA9KNP0_9GLOM|nr:3100_t:CDS:2 [Scutellospora calospora]